MKKVVVTCMLILVAAEILPAQVSTSAVPFLLIAPNSRASGMGEGGGGLADDVWALHWNPAGYAFQTGTELAMSHANWLPGFGLSDLWIAHTVFKHEMPELDGTISAGLTYLNLGEFIRTASTGPEEIGRFKGYEFAITAGYSTRALNELGLGINARFIHSRLAPFGTEEEKGTGVASGISFDLGLLYRPENVRIPFTDTYLRDAIGVGVNISNIGPSLTYIDEEQADPLPLNFRLGFAVDVVQTEFNNLTYILDFSKLLVRRNSRGKTDPFYRAIYYSWVDKSLREELRDIVTSMGLEYWYGSPKLIALRIGYFYEDPKYGNRKFMTFGAGLRYDIYGFDFSYIDAFEDKHPLGETLRFTLAMTWEKSPF
ncbi:MAG: type IX secretion system outer membrane channel protein PorV [Ignavibacteriales bacterium]|nr:type IX secretion system outer membrane channel protein PorV [Ignavibacteriales bacterium]